MVFTGLRFYAGNMDTLSLPFSQQVAVVVASGAARQSMLDLAARLAPAGPLCVLDGGNHFNAYLVARAVRRLTPRLEEALANIRLSRAFTCYQMLALLAETQAGPAPLLVLDLLSTFYDESVPLPEARRLLEAAAQHLERLGRGGGPVVVSARPPSYACPQRAVLIDALQAVLPVFFEYPAELPAAACQPALFPL